MNLYGNVILFLLSFLGILSVWSEILREEWKYTTKKTGLKKFIKVTKTKDMTFWNKKWTKCAKIHLLLSKTYHLWGELPLESIMVVKSHPLKLDLKISIHRILSEIQVQIQEFAMKMFSWIVKWIFLFLFIKVPISGTFPFSL